MTNREKYEGRKATPGLGARKFDDKKAPVALLPHAAVREVAKVLAFGAGKYGAWNWAGGMEWSRVLSAAQRHLGAFQDGEDCDQESGLLHLAHAGCCIVFLICYQLFAIGKDDRHSLMPPR